MNYKWLSFNRTSNNGCKMYMESHAIKGLTKPLGSSRAQSAALNILGLEAVPEKY